MVDGVPDTATALLDAAHAEVLAHGIRRTTASDIARRAGVSRQTLYRYWPDAQSVFAALVTRELVRALPGAAPRAASLAALVTLLVDTADEVRRMPLVERLRETDPELFARYILERIGTSQRAIHDELRRRIADGQSDGFVRSGDPSAIAAMVLLIAQSAVQSAPLVAEWLSGDHWREELGHAFGGYLATDRS
ncbi:TetR/AcrR family transcriptional regulator [Microbacterium sp. SLBN-146]|uniref:TetR/AcrR family transcriptional regulator n=1 Tax=Microbacterium sp. SLBN-146 TaxID=2768457 RepID=UPI00114FFA7D|nr:TetR/AcrR family transcriptional regulator [Microbacterium sp. SLBN-146]TQJ32666.1 TetR family transcriptional regulator [Microbacterium sp. SLBN-146]